MKRIETDILIAGGGVAGLAAAAAFGGAGFSVICVDPMPPVIDAAASNADLRTTAFLQPARDFLMWTGLWEALVSNATPLQVMRIVDAGQQPAVSRDFDAADISGDPFGWNLPNWLLRHEMVARLSTLKTVDFRPGVGFVAMLTRATGALVNLSDDTQVRTRLVIGADGRGSAVRRAAGIDVKTTRTGQKAMTFAVTHPAPHNNISTEVHAAGGPFTFVPLPDLDGKPCSSVVWMDRGAATLARAAVSEADFNRSITARSAGVYGDLTLAGPRQIWPIISQIADRIAAERVALVAEAAHVLPPIGAQGLNMSLADLACLLDLATADRAGLGGRKMLDTYQRRRHHHIRLRVAGVNALNRASMAGHPLVHDLRALGVQALHDFTPLRRGLMKLGLGAG